MHLQAKSSLPYKKYMGFYREGMKCQYLCAPAWARAGSAQKGDDGAQSARQPIWMLALAGQA
jgi:hypothetical protein